MWEEELSSIRVLHRRMSEHKVGAGSEGGESGESDEEFVTVTTGGNISEDVPLVSIPERKEPSPSEAPPTPEAPPTSAVMRRARVRQTRPESLFLEPEEPLTQILLSDWGTMFQGATSNLHSPQPCIFGLLSAEKPYYQSRAQALADKFTKTASSSRAEALRWQNGEFRVLYRFNSVSEYDAMVRDLREGRLRAVSAKGEKLRAVTLQPVRVIDAKLKCVLEIMIPPSFNTEIKHAGKPLFDAIAVASRFIFIPSISQMQHLSAVEDTDTSGPPPKCASVLLTLVTSQTHDSTARKLAEALETPVWVKHELPIDAGPLLPMRLGDVYVHRKHAALLPMVSLTAGQAGQTMGDSIRVTLLCADKYQAMIKFYSLVLMSSPVVSRKYVIFSLMDEPTSTLELCLLDAPSVSTFRLEPVTLQFLVTNMTLLAARLVRDFGCDVAGLEDCRGGWGICDPCGNKVTIHDKDRLSSAT